MRLFKYIFLSTIVAGMGCGGATPTASRLRGSLSFDIRWPDPTRSIPLNAKSVQVKVISGGKVLATASVNKPFPTLRINDLPEGNVTIVATAYDAVGGVGKPLLRGQGTSSIIVGNPASAMVTLDYPVLASFPTVQDASPITLHGSTAILGGHLRLAGTEEFVAGSAWTTDRLDVTQGFSTTFEFSAANAGGTGDTPGADGLAFVIQEDSPDVLGGWARDLGYGGISHCLAIEFDTYRNAEYGDPDNNHLSIHTNGVGLNSADEGYSIGRTSSVPNLLDGQVHVAKVDYAGGTLKVYIDDMVTPRLTVPYNLNQLGLNDGRAYVGFTASTGSSFANYDVISWSFGSS